MSSVDEQWDGEAAGSATDSGEEIVRGFEVIGDSGRDVRSIVEEEIRRIIPVLIGDSGRTREAAEGQESDDVRALREELTSTRLELQRIRAEKLLRDRDVYLKDQMRALGVRNIELAVRAVRNEVEMSDDGEWVAAINGERVEANQYLRSFVSQNPELVPARVISGTGIPSRHGELQEECDLDQIRPGMDPSSMRRAREAVVRIIAQSRRAL